ncbi:hypothetical protein LEP1GSC133_0659 [Leptospira borgpetersenii serovar Pomona str. 200901868]|uniref:Uncharacterized protein n=1 Tax=Leptospira borgpetersenii serovar Pomona str. 200901868 TaxID=1192866 RepID=M6VWW2_LEPBO|nr:hypothetical protein LEP1GSC133_0659 [Leptospira borgpetersenii serovar Pomona str. 200901868]
MIKTQQNNFKTDIGDEEEFWINYCKTRLKRMEQFVHSQNFQIQLKLKK